MFRVERDQFAVVCSEIVSRLGLFSEGTLASGVCAPSCTSGSVQVQKKGAQGYRVAVSGFKLSLGFELRKRALNSILRQWEPHTTASLNFCSLSWNLGWF